MKRSISNFWNRSALDLLADLETTKEGLSSEEAEERQLQFGPNLLKPRKHSDLWMLLLGQFKSPIILILFFATGLSFYLGNSIDAFVILSIVLVSGLLGFWQEQGATNAVEKLLSIVQIKTAIIRDGRSKEISIEEVVPGDIVILNAGDIVPGDCLVLRSKDLFVDEAMLTGETFPVEKAVALLPSDTQLGHRTNSLWMGTHVISGTAIALVARTGKTTEFGNVSERLKLRPPETEFERGIRRFGYFLMEVTLILVIAIFAFNVYLERPVLDSFLFSLALAVGLTPQLLPAIISINLAHGAKRMAMNKVIVKRLASIENFGSMNVICSDKTGTLTEGVVHVKSALDVNGNPNETVLLYAYLNAFYQTGFTNPIDEAIRTHQEFELSEFTKQDEIPYDFYRKRLSVLVSKKKSNLMVTKGALLNVMEVCSFVDLGNGKISDIASLRDQIQKQFEVFSSKGFRTLGIAYRDLGTESHISKENESEMVFSGFLILFDPPKPGIAETIKNLENLGITLKVITGDNHLVASTFSQQIGLSDNKILTGRELGQLGDEALLQRVGEVDIFAEIEPNQKERIVRTLQKAGNVVGYMGDGINDVSALHMADVGISVESAVDVAKNAADIVLLEKDLSVLLHGVKEGRTTFANTLKYVFMATSANFGNMFSMAGLSLFLPFLPLLPKQILLINLLTDFPEMTIATDNVDQEMVNHPRRWDIAAIRKFMITFGMVSSVFDYLTFGALFFILDANQIQFRTGWFVESVISASLIVIVIRSRNPFFKSRPGKYLLFTTLFIVALTIVFPFTPFAEIFGFSPLPFSFLFLIGIIILFYIFAAEIAKKIFYRFVKI